MLEVDFFAIGVSLIVVFIYIAVEARYVDKLMDWWKSRGNTSKIGDTSFSLNRKVKPGMYPLLIAFGSQSGNAEAYAKELASQAKMFRFDAKVMDIDYYDTDDLPKETFIVFINATYGEGEPTDSALEFYTWLMSSEAEDNSVDKVNYAVFGLGDSSYEIFNNIGRTIDKRMNELGATRVFELGLADANNDADEFSEWIEKFLPAAAEFFNIEVDGEFIPPVFEPAFDIEYLNSKPNEKAKFNFHEHRSDTQRGVLRVSKAYSIVNDRNPRHDGEQTTWHVEFDLNGSNITYKTAWNLGVHGKNNEDIVNRVAKHLGVDMNQTFKMVPLDRSNRDVKNCPDGVSIGDALTWHLDLSGRVRRNFLTTLAQFTTDSTEKKKLYALGSGKGADKDEYMRLFHQDRLNIAEIFDMFPTCRPPFDQFVQFTPRLIARYYTISSSSKAQPKTIAITVTEVRDKLPKNRRHFGIASSYLCNLKVGDMVPITVRDSAFKIPSDPNTPLIMVGPGTGIAPFRGIIQEAMFMKQQGVQVRNWFLFFGCRDRDIDFYYRQELEEALRAGVLQDLFVAFSRETQKKVYVQHLMDERSDLIWDMIDKQKGVLMVCGGTAMGHDVRDVLCKTVGKKTNCEQHQEIVYVHNLQKEDRFIQELWS